MKNIKIFALISTISFSVSAYAMPCDSIGTKVVNGKTYIMHKVSKGEGVYGISKKYGVTSDDIYANNSDADKGIKIDQVLLIPSKYSSANTASIPKPQTTTTTTYKTEKKYHTVEKGNTLSTIAKKYNTTVTEIKKLNNLKSDNINLGQKLVVGETKKAITVQKPVEETKKPEVVAETKVEETNNNTVDTKITTEVVKENTNVVVDVVKMDEKNKPEVLTPVTTYSVQDGDEISESGVAMISTEGELNQDRSFIYHPTAKIGTIVMITNPSNNNAVFARVVGNCKPGNEYLVKISKTVATKLGVNADTKVQLNYAL